jgi:hypothetical protein
MELVEGLTPHHRLHGVDTRIRVETLAGRWGEVRALTSPAEQAVEANEATPCVGTAAVFLTLAAASAHGGDNASARTLEARADALGLGAWEWLCEPARVRLALARHDLAELRRLVDSPSLGTQRPFVFDGAATLLDALVALGDRERIESDAPQWLQEGTYLDPFALRALGVARNDSLLLNKAAARFETMGLEWDAGETRNLVSQN